MYHDQGLIISPSMLARRGVSRCPDTFIIHLRHAMPKAVACRGSLFSYAGTTGQCRLVAWSIRIPLLAHALLSVLLMVQWVLLLLSPYYSPERMLPQAWHCTQRKLKTRLRYSLRASQQGPGSDGSEVPLSEAASELSACCGTPVASGAGSRPSRSHLEVSLHQTDQVPGEAPLSIHRVVPFSSIQSAPVVTPQQVDSKGPCEGLLCSQKIL